MADRGSDLDKLRPTFGGSTGLMPERLVDEAQRVFAELPIGVEPVVLHGDCHHYNILLSRDRLGRDGYAGQTDEEWLSYSPHWFN